MNKEEIRKFNRENNGRFIISSSELIIPTHKLPPESLQVPACWRRGERGKTQNSWEEYPHYNYYKDYNGIDHNCKSCNTIHNYLGLNYVQEHEPRIDEGRLNFFFKVTERIVQSPNQYEFSDSLKQEIKRYYDSERLRKELSTDKRKWNQWLYIDADVNNNPDPDAEPKSINFENRSDIHLRLYQDNYRGEREVQKDFYLVLTEECWKKFFEESDGAGIIYLKKETGQDADFLVKWGEREILNYIGSDTTPYDHSPTPTPHNPTPAPAPNILNDSFDYNDIAEIISELYEIGCENTAIVQRGKELGLNLVELTEDYSILQDENYGDLPVDHPRVINFVRKFKAIYQENQRKLTEVEQERDPNYAHSSQETLKQVQNQAIITITTLMNKEPVMTDSDLLENNRNWKTLINNSDSIKKINELKEQVLADILGKRKENALIVRFIDLLEEAEKEENYEKLKEIFAEVEGYHEYDIYNILADKVNALKEKLAQKNPDDYRDINLQNIKGEMERNSINEDDLDNKGKVALKSLKNSTNNNPGVVNNLTKVVIYSINKKNAENKLDKLLEEYKNAPTEVSKKSAKKKIFNFINSRENVCQEVYQNRKSEVDNLLGINSSQEINNNGFPVVPTIIFGSLGVFLIILAVILVQKPKKEELVKRANQRNWW